MKKKFEILKENLRIQLDLLLAKILIYYLLQQVKVQKIWGFSKILNQIYQNLKNMMDQKQDLSQDKLEPNKVNKDIIYKVIKFNSNNYKMLTD